MSYLQFFIFLYTVQANPESQYEDYYYEDYYKYNDDLSTGNSGSTPLPPIFREGSTNDINIENVPACRDDPDNIDCRSVYMKIEDLKNKDKINIPGIGTLSLNYKTEDEGIHTHFYDGDDEVTATFTFSDKSLFGSIHLKDGKIKRIFSYSEFKQISSLIDVPNSIRKSESSDSHPHKDFSMDKLTKKERDLIKQGENDKDTIVQVMVTVYYNEAAKKHFMKTGEKEMVAHYISEANEGFRRSFVPIKLILLQSTEAPSSLSDINLKIACKKGSKLLSSTFNVNDTTTKCEKNVIDEFRKSKGTSGRNMEQAKRVRQKADVAILLVYDINGDFCGKVSQTFSIGRPGPHANLAVLSVRGACTYTFTHELGHLFGLTHQKIGGGENPYFRYGHGKNVKKKKGDIDGTRTIMASGSGSHLRRLNIFSNPRVGNAFGSIEFEDSARVLSETRFLGASYHTEGGKEYSLSFPKASCHKSEICVPFLECSNQLTPKNFLRKICESGMVCCQINLDCIQQFPEVDPKETGWFILINREKNHTMQYSGTYSVNNWLTDKKDKRQLWKWEGNSLIPKWDETMAIDSSSSPYKVVKKTGSKSQQFRFSDGFWINLSSCGKTRVVGGMSISHKWFALQVEEETVTKNDPDITFTAHVCPMDEICTEISHCYETTQPKDNEKRFCDKERVCCKSKICHDVETFEAVDDKIEDWFIFKSDLNGYLLTLKDGSISYGTDVVNSPQKSDFWGQVWRWNENQNEKFVSNINGLVLDGSFGKVSVKADKIGNIYQKWRMSNGYMVNAGHCEVLDVAYGKNEADALVTIWSVHGKSHQKWRIQKVKQQYGKWKLG